MSKFYTHVAKYGNNILVRGYDDGKQFKVKVPYKPTLYLNDPSSTSEIKSLEGNKLKPISFDSINDAWDFTKRYKDTSNFKIYGNPAWPYQYISDYYPEQIVWDIDQVRTHTIDIETTVNGGFPDIRNPAEEILLITVQDKVSKNIDVFTYKEYNKVNNETIHLCKDEKDLLIKFCAFWNMSKIDIITGWNCKFFDIPYVISRINYLYGEDSFVDQLSPWGQVKYSTVEVNGKENVVYDILGVSMLDYFDLYKKYIKEPRESYKLDNIASVELGENKKKNPYKTFKEFYSKDWQKFVEYNINDVLLVDKLEDKLKLIELQLTTAYMAKVNYQDIFGQVKVWETLIYNYLRKQNIVPSISSRSSGSSTFEGAYVKAPIPGKYKYVASFDLDSLYPHLIMQYNMSPETMVSDYTELVNNCTVDEFLNKEINTSNSSILNYSTTANGVCYDNSKSGFLPALMESMYSDRKKFKTKMLGLKKEYQKNKSKELEYQIASLDNLQLALKICLNSAYGALGNSSFKYFDVRIAEGITLSGQLSIRWISNHINLELNKFLKTKDVDYVIYIDTDSCYINLENVVELYNKDKTDITETMKIDFMDKFCEKYLKPVIDKSTTDLREYMNAKAQKMSMKRENLCDVCLWVAKKKYILNVWDSEGIRYNEPKLKFTGVELVKGSTPDSVKPKLKEIVNVILRGTNSDLRKIIKNFKTPFLALPLEEIAFPKGVNEIEKYTSDNGSIMKSTPINVRASLLFNQLIDKHNIKDKYQKITSGDKIKFVYLKTPNPIRQNVIGFNTNLPEEFGLHDYIDYDLMYEKVFLNSIEIMAKSVNWTINEESALTEFF